MKNRDIPLSISRSNVSTEINRTGFWRYMRPVFIRKTAPCTAACPVGEDVARIEKLVHQGLFKRALETVLAENPFPSVCGRVCFHPCENRCNRMEFDQAVAIHHVERFLGDEAVHQNISPGMFRFPVNGKKIAVVGGGPAGLSASYFLSLLGFTCDVFESEPEPGGILRWGIPSYRMPTAVLSSEIDRIKGLGVNIYCGGHVTMEHLGDMKQNYDGIFIGCGHGRSIKLNIPGESLAMDGLDLLAAARKEGLPPMRGPVVVIGGGNTAIDVSRSLAGMGADVTIAYRRRQKDMPAFQKEIESALAEGASLKELLAPVGMEEKEDHILISFQQMKVGGEDADGRMRAIPDGSQRVSMEAGRVVTAIGADVAEPWHLPQSDDPPQVDLTHCTAVPHNIPVVYGGDLTNRTKSVADAVASGKQGAMVLDILLTEGWEDLSEKLKGFTVGNGPALSMEKYMGGERKERDPHIVAYDEINIDYFPRRDRMTGPADNKPIRAADIVEESGRCFNCGSCNDCDNCWLYCPEVAVSRDEKTGRSVNMDYCKGCGICVVECPRCAMALVEEAG